jgi:tetratricopeptide (TPR) repeat protein
VQGSLQPLLQRLLLAAMRLCALVHALALPSRLRRHLFLRDALSLIDILAERGAPVSEHLLSAARFQALLANGDHVRRGFIERAVTSSQSADERMRALLTLSRYRTDVSDYHGARRALAECAELLGDEDLAPWRPEYEWSLGVAHFYADPARSSGHFEEAVRLSRPLLLDSPGVRQPLASSLHYLGRLAAAGQEFARALELFVQAERVSDDYLSSHGFYHQRVAEVLIDHGTLPEAEFHLLQSQRTFDQVGQKSSGMSLLGGLWSRFYLRGGEFNKADAALTAAITKSRTEEGPRVELMLLAEKLRLRVRQRRLFGLPVLLCRAVWLYARAESNRSPAMAVRQLVIVGRQAVRMLLPRRHSSAAPLSCPCGGNHLERPEAQPSEG